MKADSKEDGMADFRMECEKCGQHIEVPEEMVGETAECPSCGVEIVTPIPSDEADPNPAPSAPEECDGPPAPEAPESPKRSLGKSLIAAAGAAAGEAKRGAKITGLKAQIEKIRRVDLQRAYCNLGKKAYEVRFDADTHGEAYAEIESLDVQIADQRAGVKPDADATMAQKAKAAAVTAKMKARAEALAHKRKGRISALGESVWQSGDSSGEISREATEIQALCARIAEMEAQLAAAVADHSTRDELNHISSSIGSQAADLAGDVSRKARTVRWKKKPILVGVAAAVVLLAMGGMLMRPKVKSSDGESNEKKKEVVLPAILQEKLYKDNRTNELVVAINTTEDVNISDRGARNPTPLHLAVNYNLLSIVELLLEKGADVSATNKYGQTPLHRVSGDNPEILKQLVQAGADVDGRDGTGDTPLLDACSGANLKLVRQLLEAGADATAVDKQGNNGLHHLADRLIYSKPKEADARQLVELLVSKGVDVNAKNENGKAPIALLGLEPEYMYFCLLQHGAKKSDIDLDLESHEQAVGSLMEFRIVRKLPKARGWLRTWYQGYKRECGVAEGDDDTANFREVSYLNLAEANLEVQALTTPDRGEIRRLFEIQDLQTSHKHLLCTDHTDFISAGRTSHRIVCIDEVFSFEDENGFTRKPLIFCEPDRIAVELYERAIKLARSLGLR